MTTYKVHNGPAQITGDGDDKLIVTFDQNSAVHLDYLSGNLSSGYSGDIGAHGSGDVEFSGILRMSVQIEGVGDDSIYNGAANDTISTGVGDDTIVSLGGSDHIDGGDGIDTWGATLTEFTDGVKLDMTKGDSHKYGEHGIVTGIESLVLTLGDGKDVIVAAPDGGRNYIDAGGGNDRITVPLAYSDLNGQAGVDTLTIVQYQAIGANVSFADGTASLDGASSVAVNFQNFENIAFRSVGAGDDDLRGGSGSDSFNAGQGADSLVGNEGNDLLNGGDGADTIDAGAGDDTVNGGLGLDVLQGGDGRDVFAFGTLKDSLKSAPDTIADLDKTDHIDLSRIDADSVTDGDQAFTLVTKLDGHTGEVALAYDASNDRTVVSMDVDGDGKADSVIWIAGDHHDFQKFVL